MTNINLMVWNVQNFGESKSGMLHNNYDILLSIANVVVSNNIDIFCLVELNTTKPKIANAICQNMISALSVTLEENGGNPDYYQTCITSQNTGLEFYAFFIKDTSVVIPICPYGTRIPNSDPPKFNKIIPSLIGGPNTSAVSLEDVLFAPVDKPVVLVGGAPLILPDLKRLSSLRDPVDFPGIRLPCLAMFAIPSASPENQLFPIALCHLIPNDNSAPSQLGTFPFMSLFQSFAPNTASNPVSIFILDDGNAVQKIINSAIITGDFNIDYLQNQGEYSLITGNGTISSSTGVLGLSGEVLVNANTHLITLEDYTNLAQKPMNTADLAINAYDNVILINSSRSTTPITSTQVSVIDIPGKVMMNEVILTDSIQYYAENDMRGLSLSVFNDFERDLAEQIYGGDDPAIDMQAALIGARIISDHLPVAVTLVL